ncbi:RRQRL motif-containing zinc-binding protein [Streptomyces sp. NPDC051020]|uniref:RRQRL motif-containing zinc-binding protein n=1 Tax=Streptomyces sp. NPDC051020 TaxID=3155409 RepID=UPI003414FF88
MEGQDENLVDVDVYDDGISRFPEYAWNSAPTDLLATRRQLRAAGLRPGGHGPVAQLRCRRCSYQPHAACTHLAWLYRIDLAKPKIPMTLAKEAALDRAMATRTTCPVCQVRFDYCLPLKTLGSCWPCSPEGIQTREHHDRELGRDTAGTTALAA